MTIKIELEALLCVANGAHLECPKSIPGPLNGIDCDSQQRALRCTSDDDHVVSSRNILSTTATSLKLDFSIPKLDDTDCDCTVSTCSVADSCVTPDERDRRVTFSTPLVTDMRTRPRTRTEDITSLFYTYEETQRFRQDYRLERKLLATLKASSDDLVCEQKDNGDDNLKNTSSCYNYRISRVVVLHEDSLETFYDNEIGKEIRPNISSEKLCLPANNEFFDNDNFWSGSITWF